MNNKEEHDFSIANTMETIINAEQYPLDDQAKGQGFYIVKDRINNPEALITINKFVDNYNHTLNRSMIEFEDAKKFTNPVMEDIKFMTMDCKFGAIIQRKFLEGKYPSHLIHSKDLYATIQRF
ncbi:7089_t:CDS:2 [Funneliformis geosporum]|nr:7089_t:CDS:2 [Funneliformis geosporum]